MYFSRQVYFLVFLMVTSTTYASETWLCVDDADDSIYKVEITENQVRFIYPVGDDLTFKALPHGRDDVIYAVKRSYLSPAAKKQKHCHTCLLGGDILAIDKEKKTIYRAMRSFGTREKRGGEVNMPGLGVGYLIKGHEYKTNIYESNHRCSDSPG